jgi:hypothetical protein
VPPAAYPVVRALPKYRPLRLTALISIGLMGLTAIVAVIQSIALWWSYDDVKRFVYGLLSEGEISRGIDKIAGTGPLLDLASYLFLGTGIAFLIWLWQARDNAEVIKPALAAADQGGYDSRGGAHRHAQGWIVGGWFCPIVQFWYPLQVVEDVVRTSEPPERPDSVRPRQLRALLYGWWASWAAFWVILVAGGGFAVVSFIVWMVRLVDRVDAADATGDYVDIYDLQDFMVRVALAVNIGFTVATVLLIIAGVAISLVLLRVTSWQDTRGKVLGLFPPAQSRSEPPQHPAGQPAPALSAQVSPVPPSQDAPRPRPSAGQPAQPPRSFPSYTPWQGPD